MERDFLDIKKDKMTKVEHNVKFWMILSFGRRLELDEEIKVGCYKCGLPWDFKWNLGTLANWDLAMRKA